jgi:hypothetical protein
MSESATLEARRWKSAAGRIAWLTKHRAVVDEGAYPEGAAGARDAMVSTTGLM